MGNITSILFFYIERNEFGIERTVQKTSLAEMVVEGTRLQSWPLLDKIFFHILNFWYESSI
jgi:hypothetical protein